jgi:hypothetical protein
MSVRSGPSNIKNGLVFYYDSRNSEKSWKGKPTTNLLYDSGVINWSIGNLTASVSRSTVITNSVYRITSTTGGAFRLYVPLAKLTNALSYNLSYKYKIISGSSASFSMSDWCDTTLQNVVNITYSDYKFSSAYGTRSTYDSTYRFMDFNISANTVVEIWDVQLEQNTFATPFINGTRSATEAIVDLTNNRIVTVNSLTYSTDGKFIFNGSNSLTIPSIDFQTEQTIEIWLKPTESDSARRNPYNQAYGGYGTWTHEPSGNINYYYGDAGANNSPYISHTSSFTVIENEIACVCTTRTTTESRWYKNGVFYNSYAHSYQDLLQHTTNITIGSGYAGSYVGEILAVKLYNRALSAEEVKQNFDAVKSKYVGQASNNPAFTAKQILDIDPSAANGFYWISPASHSGAAEYVYVDFDGSVSGITDSGPWIRIRYAQDYYSSASPWTNTGNSSTAPGAFSGDFSFEQNRTWINSMLNNAVDVRQRFESWGNGSVGWTYANGEYMGVKTFAGDAFNGANGSNIVKTNKPTGISHGVTDFNTFNNPTATGTDPCDINDAVWRVGVFYFRDISGNKILPIAGIWNGDVDTSSEQRYFPFRNGEATAGVNSDIWIKLK